MFLAKKQMSSKIPKYKQIISLIENAIIIGELKTGDQLPSLNNLRNKFKLSRDTVITAFNELRARGVIYSVVGKGYYVKTIDIKVQVKILLLFDELNSFKEDLYNSFLEELDDDYQIDIFFHHFNFDLFKKIIDESAGNYGYYVIMPANFSGVAQILEPLPDNKTYILDQTQEAINHFPSIYQNFENYIYDGLTVLCKNIRRYKKLILIYDADKQPSGIKSGFELFCSTNKIKYGILGAIDNKVIKKGEVYFTLNDSDLIKTIKKLKQTSFQLGQDIGIISFNDTLLKEILEGGITTISADFKFMGSHLAKMLKNNALSQIENPKKVILRKSL